MYLRYSPPVMVNEQAVSWPPSSRSGRRRGKTRLPLHLRSEQEDEGVNPSILDDWCDVGNLVTEIDLNHDTKELPFRVHCVNGSSHSMVNSQFNALPSKIPSTCPALTRSSGRSRDSDFDLKSMKDDPPPQPATSSASNSAEVVQTKRSNCDQHGIACNASSEDDLDGSCAGATPQSRTSSISYDAEQPKTLSAPNPSDLKKIGEQFIKDVGEQGFWDINDYIAALLVRLPDQYHALVRHLLLEDWDDIQDSFNQSRQSPGLVTSETQSPPRLVEPQVASVSHDLSFIMAQYEVLRGSTQGFKKRFPELDAKLSTLPRRRSVDNHHQDRTKLLRERISSFSISLQQIPDHRNSKSDHESSSDNGIYTPSTSDSGSLGCRSHSEDDLEESRLDERELLRRVKRMLLCHLSPEPSEATAHDVKTSTANASLGPPRTLAHGTSTMVYHQNSNLSTAGLSFGNGFSNPFNGTSLGRSVSPRSHGSNDGNDGDDGSDSPDPKGGSDRHAAASPLSCPFFIRNPIRFNVHDYLHCSKQWKSLPLLKRHLRAAHLWTDDLPFKCSRCKTGFSSQNKLEEHGEDTRLFPCPVVRQSDVPNRPVNPEDGISSAAMRKLMSRRRGSAINNWDNLWHLLFPMDKVVLPPLPRSSSDLIADSFRRREPELIHAIDAILRDHLEASSAQRLAGPLTGIFQDHINNTLQGTKSPGHNDHDEQQPSSSVLTPAPSRRPSTVRRWSDETGETWMNKKRRKEHHLDVSAKDETLTNLSPQMLNTMRFGHSPPPPDIRVWDEMGHPLHDMSWQFELS